MTERTNARRIAFSPAFRGFLHITVFLFGFLFSSVLVAEEAAAPDCNFDKFGEALAGRESNGRYNLENSFGYLGKYQFGTETLSDLGFYAGPTSAKVQNWSGPWTGFMGINSKEDFLNSKEAQEYVFQKNQGYLWSQIQSKGLDKYVGQTINGVTITESGLLAGCHLKGCGGLNKCLNGSGSCTDGYGTNVYEYLQKFGGYNTPWGGGGNCQKYANTASPRGETYGDPRCAENIRTHISALVEAAKAQRTDIFNNVHRPPMSVQQNMKVPCKSNELQRVANMFSYAPTGYGSSALGQLNSLAGPVSGLMNNLFKADFQSFSSMLKSAGGLSTDFGGFVQGQLSGLLGSLGLGNSPFASALCGLMADTLLKYIQCEAPIKLPSLGSLTGSLNKLLPQGCAGEAVRGALYGAASQTAFRPAGQSISGMSGIFSGSTPLKLGPAPTQ